MKKTIKILSIILIIMAIILPTVQTSFAAYGEGVGDVINATTTGGGEIDNGVTGITATIVNWIWAFSIIVAIIVLMIIGIKYIIGGTQEKADYKKSLIPVLVGVIVIVFATTIVKFLFTINTKTNNQQQPQTVLPTSSIVEYA